MKMNIKFIIVTTMILISNITCAEFLEDTVLITKEGPYKNAIGTVVKIHPDNNIEVKIWNNKEDNELNLQERRVIVKIQDITSGEKCLETSGILNKVLKKSKSICEGSFVTLEDGKIHGFADFLFEDGTVFLNNDKDRQIIITTFKEVKQSTTHPGYLVVDHVPRRCGYIIDDGINMKNSTDYNKHIYPNAEDNNKDTIDTNRISGKESSENISDEAGSKENSLGKSSVNPT